MTSLDNTQQTSQAKTVPSVMSSWSRLCGKLAQADTKANS